MEVSYEKLYPDTDRIPSLAIYTDIEKRVKNGQNNQHSSVNGHRSASAFHRWAGRRAGRQAGRQTESKSRSEKKEETFQALIGPLYYAGT